jgi:hypothetical protein
MTARVSVSSWSLHRALGSVWLDDFTAEKKTPPNKEAAIRLLELPGLAAQHGINTLEICHFHFPSRENGFLVELASEASHAGVEIFSILIDDADITAPDPEEREIHLSWIRGWIDTANTLGAKAARVVAGEDTVSADAQCLADHPSIQLSARQLKSLYAYGQDKGVKVFTENFRPLSLKADHLIAILELCEGQITICADFGNFKGPDRYTEFAKIAPWATSGHAKAQYEENGAIIPDDLAGGIQVLKRSGFAGPLSLIFDQPMVPNATEWDYLDSMKKVADVEL